MTQLSTHEIADLASRVYGPGWQSALARDRGVAIRTVQRWAKDGIAKPETAEAIRAYLQSRTVVSVPAQPSIQASGECNPSQILDQAMCKIADEIIMSTKAAGWTEEQAQEALRNAIVNRNWREG